MTKTEFGLIKTSCGKLIHYKDLYKHEARCERCYQIGVSGIKEKP